MACEITRGRVLPCKDGIAGIVAVFFIDNPNDAPVQITYGSNKVTDIQVNGGGGITAYKYAIDNDTSIFVEAPTANRQNGSFFCLQTLTLQIQGLLEEDLPELENIAKGRPAVVVQYRNGFARLMGATRGVDYTGDNTSGGALGDFIGLNMVLTANEEKFAPLLTGATKANPFAGLITAPTVIFTNDES
jgi:hypothetical protein